MNPKVRVIVEFMKTNLHRQLTLDEIGGLVGLSHSRVENLFKAELGRAPIRYHKEMRLEKAREFLENTFLNVKQVRLEVGYPDPRRFFRDFKKHFGLTPLQYRARYITAKIDRKDAANKNSDIDP